MVFGGQISFHQGLFSFLLFSELEKSTQFSLPCLFIRQKSVYLQLQKTVTRGISLVWAATPSLPLAGKLCEADLDLPNRVGSFVVSLYGYAKDMLGKKLLVAKKTYFVDRKRSFTCSL